MNCFTFVGSWSLILRYLYPRIIFSDLVINVMISWNIMIQVLIAFILLFTNASPATIDTLGNVKITTTTSFLLRFALRIREHQTSLCVIRLSQTALFVADTQVILLNFCLSFFCLFHLLSSLRQSLHCGSYFSARVKWDVNKIFTREIISVTAGDIKCGCFVLFLLVFCSLKDIEVFFFFWKGCSTLWVCESEERVVMSEWHVMIGKLKLRVWSTLPVKHFWTQWILA